MSLFHLTPQQLRLAARLKEKAAILEAQLEKLLTGTILGRSPAIRTMHTVHKKRRALSKAARARIGAATRKRWANLRAKK